MTARIPATGFDTYIPEDRPALYVETGAGNIQGVQEVHLTFVDQGEETVLGWYAVGRLRDILNSLTA